MHKKRIPELVILPNQIDGTSGLGLNLHDNKVSCGDCNSNLMYITIEWGVVDEEDIFEVMGNRSERIYALREVGMVTHCAKCSCFNENYSKWFYPKEKIVMRFDEIDGPEREEVQHCLLQFNQKGDFKPLYKWHGLNLLKEKLKEFEIKFPLKKEKKKK